MQPERDQRKRESGKRGRTFAFGKLRSFACETCAGGENLRGKGDRSKATTPCPLGLSPPFRGGQEVSSFDKHIGRG